jgi:hypothetical protein
VPDPLDRLLADLASAPADRRLDQLEPAVWARIEAERRPVAGFLRPARAATVALALVGGAVLGGLQTARAPQAESVLTADAALAPSTLLDGRG